jgi:hypothetical protein
MLIKFARSFAPSLVYPKADYVWRMWKMGYEAFTKWWTEERIRRRLPIPDESVIRAKWGSYQNFCNYFYWLRRLGLVEFVKSEPAFDAPREALEEFEQRNYYRISKLGLETPPSDLRWRNPRRALYPRTWKRKRL